MPDRKQFDLSPVDRFPGSDKPQRTGRHRKRRPDTRERILAAAIRLFHDQGYLGTSIDQIGAAAGVSGPGVYRHFKSKQDILDEAARRGSELVFSRADEIVGSSADPKARLDALAKAFISAVVDEPHHIAIFLQALDQLSPDVLRWCRKAVGRFTEQWVGLIIEIRPDVPETEARVAVRGVFAAVVSVTEYRGGLSSDRIKTIIRDLVMNGLTSSRSWAP